MNHQKNTSKKPILKYIKVVPGQWNIIRKDVGSTEFVFIKPSHPTEKDVKLALEEMKKRLM